MKILAIQPYNFPCTIEECPPGFFIFEGLYLGFKSEYRTESGKIEVYNSAGEHFQYNENTLVQPVDYSWEEM